MQQASLPVCLSQSEAVGAVSPYNPLSAASATNQRRLLCVPSAKELTNTLLYRRRGKVLCVYLMCILTYCDFFVKVGLATGCPRCLQQSFEN